jgi:uncharacterized protein (DUF2141 family)
MKPTQILAFVFAASIVCGHAGSQGKATASGCTLRIRVDGLRNSTGVVGAAIFKTRDGWPENMSKTVNHWPTPIAQGAHQATAVMENLPAGDYGVVAIHDENKNHKLDRNFIGFPKEGFGFANNPHVACPVTEINIHIIYK